MRSINDLMNLQGRVALVTGGAGRIGEALCEALAELGASVAVLDLSEEACRRVASQIQTACLPLAIDLADDQSVRSVPNLVQERFGRLDVLVNCAALVGTSELKGWATPFDEQTIDTWRLALEVNLTAPFLLTQVCTDLLRQSGKGSVININSIYGMVGPDLGLYEGTPMGNPAAYAASKGGLLQLTRWLATSLAPEVRVNSITSGGVERNQPDAFVERYLKRTPLKRMAVEEDLKGAVAYLASDLSSYVTGQNLIVDGGWTAW